MYDKLVSLVERMLALHKHLRPRTPQEQEMVKREIESTDRHIDLTRHIDKRARVFYNDYGKCH